MDNSKLTEFINAIGALTEIWTVSYRGFITQGYSASEALIHTREFTAALMTAMLVNGNN